MRWVKIPFVYVLYTSSLRERTRAGNAWHDPAAFSAWRYNWQTEIDNTRGMFL